MTVVRYRGGSSDASFDGRTRLGNSSCTVSSSEDLEMVEDTEKAKGLRSSPSTVGNKVVIKES